MSARWLARAAFVLVLAAAADLIGFADLASLAMVAVGVVGACLMLAGGYWFLAHRGFLRWLALAVVVLAPAAVLVIFALHGLLWVASGGDRADRAGGCTIRPKALRVRVPRDRPGVRPAKAKPAWATLRLLASSRA
jgi:hypothetical protein